MKTAEGPQSRVKIFEITGRSNEKKKSLQDKYPGYEEKNSPSVYFFSLTTYHGRRSIAKKKAA
jgi:hypothetical protein